MHSRYNLTTCIFFGLTKAAPSFLRTPWYETYVKILQKMICFGPRTRGLISALKLYFEGFIIYSTNILLLTSFCTSFCSSSPQNAVSNQYKISVETTYAVKTTSVLAQLVFTPYVRIPQNAVSLI